MAPHQRKQATILRAGRIDLPPAVEEVMIDEPDDMEAIGHDEGFGEVFAHDRSIGGREIHADDPYFIFAFQGL